MMWRALSACRVEIHLDISSWGRRFGLPAVFFASLETGIFACLSKVAVQQKVN
jgi:hypothetical protein